MKTLLIFGSTGLVGQQLLKLALADSSVGQVIAPTRKPLPPQARLINPLVSFDDLPSDAAWWRVDAALCALGTTMRQAGSQAAFRQVDHDYVLAAARLAHHAGTPAFVLTSSVGADLASKSFYLRVKAEAERELAQLGFASLTLVRPSLLDGGPRPQRRLAEEIGIWLARLFAPLIPARYRAVSTAEVAACMLAAALTSRPGTSVCESESIPRDAKTYRQQSS